ncbi:MAG: M36 family metallopeptidase [Verrucomicrobia bacterium]|nr:M36 family metallopeptidase [Verrucomicrobiota bacterium]
MKIRFLTAACSALLAALPLASFGVLPPQQPALANFDKRLDANRANGGAAGQPAGPVLQNNIPALSEETLALQNQAAVKLKSRLPGVKIERDGILGMPRLVSAPRGFLTGAQGKGRSVEPQSVDALSADDPHRPIKAFLNEYSGLFGHGANVLNSARIKRDYVTEHNGLRTVIWEQMLDGIPVFEGLLSGNVTKNGELVNISSRFVPDANQAANAGAPNRAARIRTTTITAARAIVLAAANLGAEVDESTLVSQADADGAELRQAFRAPGLRGDARVKLVWVPMHRNLLRLAWRVELCNRALPELYSVVVDAQTGEAIVRRNLTSYISSASYRVYDSDSPSPKSPGYPFPTNTQPAVVARKLLKITAISTNASPAGWINDGDNETRGNNVDAHTDHDNDDQADLPRPQGSPNRVFDFPLDLNQSPLTYTNASVVNLFYWNNFMHDQLYALGFTEAAGNFQNDNFGRGGQGNDAVQADAQDGGGFDNANFSTPGDGEPPRMQMYLFSGPDPNRDGALDAEVMCHEYTHGLSHRLVGGDVGISELQTAGMGEGWSDFYSLALLSQSGDDPRGNYPEGGYVSYLLGGLTENYYYGVRRYPYTTEMTRNPLTLKDIDPTKADTHPGIPLSPVSGGSPADEVHNQGEVWCVTLWEARANLIDKLGFPQGNQTILQLVTDGMKLSPANPTFLEARDAILQADEIASGGDNRSELWQAFAKRGMGFSATVPTSDTTLGVGEAFDVPDDVLAGTPDGILEVTVTPHAGSALFASTTEPIFVRITDGIAVTNATILASVNGTTPLIFKNDGTAPDTTANNSVYSAALAVPTTTNTVTLTLIISAPEKDTSTNVVTYSIIPVPANDNFTNAIKVPTLGANYLSNNKVATTEPGEPRHAGLATAGASLWWVYSAPNDSDLLIDTAGSGFDTVIAVYTGSSLKSLKNVASADNEGKRKQAFLSLHAVKGTAYHIAVASANTNGTGTLNLGFTANGQPDLNPPVVTVSSPPSGLFLTTNRVLLAGTAVDPQPFASGVNQILTRVTSKDGIDASMPPGIDNAAASASSPVLTTNWSRIVALQEGLNVVQVTATDFAGNLSDPVTLQVTYRPPDPVNDLFVRATPLTATSGTNLANTAHASKEAGEPQHAGNAGGKSVWWSFKAPADGILFLTTTNSNFDTLLAVYTGQHVNALSELVSNDDATTGSGYSQLQLGVTANQIYYIAVDGYGGVSGLAYLSYDFIPSSLFKLTVAASNGGRVNLNSAAVKANTSVVLVATADPGFDFAGWSGGVTSTQNPLSIVVTSDLSLTASFVPHTASDDFNSANLTHLPWTTSGSAPWVVPTASARTATTTNGPANRKVPASYSLSQIFPVTITMTPASSVGAYSIVENLPTGWLASSIDNSGSVDASTGQIKWGPFFDHQPRVLSYHALPAGDAVGIVTFSGSATVDGVTTHIAGDSETALLAARSGAIGSSQQSSLSLVTNLPAGSGSFDVRVSSESGWDFLEFYINGILDQRWSGEVVWLTHQFVVSAGRTALEWRYVKDASLSVGLDAAFIDNLQLPIAGAALVVPAVRLEMFAHPTGALRLQLQGESGREYIVEASSDLKNWQPVSTNVAAEGVIDIVDPQANKVPFRYYRALSR